jgi:hypothetical protein
MKRPPNIKKVKNISKLRPLTVFQSLNVIVRPAHGFEFDMLGVDYQKKSIVIQTLREFQCKCTLYVVIMEQLLFLYLLIWKRLGMEKRVRFQISKLS